MSAPDTDLKKQEKRHFGPLLGISAGLVLAIVLIGAFVFTQVSPPEGEEAEAVETAPAATVESD